jgi:hypothetical protein
MISAEDRARAAMRAIADTVHDAPPLQPAPVRKLPRAAAQPRRWRPRLAPVAAAVAVAAVAIGLVIVKNVPNGRLAAPVPSTVAPAASATAPSSPATSGAPKTAPEHYVALMQAPAPYLVVGDTFTGKRSATIMAPDGVYLQGVYGAADDDATFIVTGDRQRGVAASAVWYLLRIAPGGGARARLTPLPIPVRQDPAGVAVSPDGTELAVALPGSPATLRVYSMATGNLLRTWSATVPGELTAEKTKTLSPDLLYTAMVLRWSSDGRQLAFAWDASGIRVLNAAAPDGNLITSSTAIAAIGTTYTPDGSFVCHAAQGWQLIAGGRGVVCGGSAQTELLQTSPAGGGQPTAASGGSCTRNQQTDIGFITETKFSGGGGEIGIAADETGCAGQAQAADGAYIGWASADGSILIGSQVWDGHSRFGIFRGDRFTPLPALPASTPTPTGVLLGTDAW